MGGVSNISRTCGSFFAVGAGWPGNPARYGRCGAGLTCRRGASKPPPHRPVASSPSSRGLGHHPFKVATRVRIPLGTPNFPSFLQSYGKREWNAGPLRWIQPSLGGVSVNLPSSPDRERRGEGRPDRIHQEIEQRVGPVGIHQRHFSDLPQHTQYQTASRRLEEAG